MAGVSPITASRALNNPRLVHPKTIKRVQTAAEKLAYVPSPVAQGLRSGRTRIITLVTESKSTYDPLLFEFATGVSAACHDKGYSLLIHPMSDLKGLHTLTEKVDGLILTDIRQQDERILELQEEIPVAIFGQSQHDVPQIDVDNIRGAEIATRYLADLGYKDILLITAQSDLLFLRHREDGYRKTMQSLGFPPQVIYTSYDAKGGEEALLKLDRVPEAIVCTSDLLALGALRGLRERKLNIPVVGYDGGYLTEVSIPKLTSIRQPFHAIGELITLALFKYMENGETVSKLVEPELVAKDSTWACSEVLTMNIQSK